MTLTVQQPEPIPVATAVFTEDEARAAYEVVRSGWVTMGERVKEFERAFATYVDARHAIAMCNGTVTLHAALAALGIGPGDEVILPTLTYISTANVVLYQGAIPVLCECDPETCNVTPSILERHITSRTRAIITVDMNGLPIDYDPIVALAARHDIPIIADSAESLAAIYRGRRVGSQALVHSFSFFGNKNITTGEGGMITTNDDRLADKLRILRNQGQEGRYRHTHLGFNYRMTDVAAAIGLVQLSRLEQTVEAKVAAAASYDALLAPHARLIEMLPVPDYVDRHSWYLYAVRVANDVDRDAVGRALDRERIETRVSFPPVHIQPYYVQRFGYAPDDFPISYATWRRLLDLPISPVIRPDQIRRVAELTATFAQGNRRGSLT